MNEFLEAYYIITNDEHDRIHKDDFTETYNAHFKSKKFNLIIFLVI